MAKQEPTKSSAASIDETTKALFGQFPADVIIPIRWGEETLDRLEAVFHAIELLHEKGGQESRILHLAKLGSYVASDMSNCIGCEYESRDGVLQKALAAESEVQS